MQVKDSTIAFPKINQLSLPAIAIEAQVDALNEDEIYLSEESHNESERSSIDGEAEKSHRQVRIDNQSEIFEIASNLQIATNL